MFHFGLGNGKVGKTEQARIQRTIDKANLNATFVAVDSPSLGTRYWFEARNYGAPFDQDLAKSVLSVVGTIKTRP